MKNNAQKFYMNLASLQADFQQVGDDARQRLQRLVAGIASLSSNADIQTRDHSKSPLADLVQMNLDNTKELIARFERNTQDYLHNTQFRDQFSDSLLIFVYGKVNAGKSSLGNFVASYPASGHKPHFFRYDEAGQQRSQAELEELKEVDGFEIKETEATSSIQGFRLPGLSWIDTPGLHSMTPVNGQLAQDYIDAADLVLYITSSDSPGRSSDAKEITELVKHRAKKVCILLTKSDIQEEDEVDGELVAKLCPKPASVRTEQEAWVRKQMEDYLKADAAHIGDILSVSVLLAKHGPAEWSGSNMDVFYDLLNTQAIRQARALKEATPRKRLNSLIQRVLEGEEAEQLSLQYLRQQFSELADKAAQSSKQLLACKLTVLDDIETEMHGVIATIVDKHAASKNDKAIRQDIESQLTEMIRTHLTSSIAKHISDFNDHLPLALQLNDAIALTDKTERLAYTVTHSGKGAAAGGLLGGFLGSVFPVVGTLIGGAIGSIAGGLIGGAMDEKRYKDIILGDNREEVIRKLQQNMQKNTFAVIENALKQVHDNYFAPVERLAAGRLEQLDQLRLDLNSLQYPSV